MLAAAKVPRVALALVVAVQLVARVPQTRAVAAVARPQREMAVLAAPALLLFAPSSVVRRRVSQRAVVLRLRMLVMGLMVSLVKRIRFIRLLRRVR